MKKSNKKCSRCNEYKKITEFYHNKNNKDGLQTWCKKCHDIVKKEYRLKNIEKEREQGRIRNKRYQLRHPEKNNKIACRRYYRYHRKEFSLKAKKRYKNNDEFRKRLIVYSKNYYQQNKEDKSKYQKEYLSRPKVIVHKKEYRKEYSKNYYEKNRDKLREYHKEWYKKNQDHIKKYRQERLLLKQRSEHTRGMLNRINKIYRNPQSDNIFQMEHKKLWIKYNKKSDVIIDTNLYKFKNITVRFSLTIENIVKANPLLIHHDIISGDLCGRHI